MKGLGLSRYALAIGAASALLAGCGGSQAGGLVPMDLIHRQTQARKTQTSSGDLVYATGGCGGVCIFSYPDGILKAKISLTFPLGGDCSDGKGNVFVTNNAQVLEYAHGGITPIATLTLPGVFAAACGVDPKTGNLAVVFGGDSAGNIAIFANATGTPLVLPAGQGAYFCGYDNSGNFFVSGRNNQVNALAELPYGSSTFIPITFYDDHGGPNQMQWDGKYMTWESSGRDDTTILRFSVSGSTATIVGTTHIKGPKWLAQSWIADNRVIIPYASQGNATNKIGVWRYSKGGRVLAKFGNFGQNANTRVLGVALSVTPSGSHIR